MSMPWWNERMDGPSKASASTPSSKTVRGSPKKPRIGCCRSNGLIGQPYADAPAAAASATSSETITGPSALTVRPRHYATAGPEREPSAQRSTDTLCSVAELKTTDLYRPTGDQPRAIDTLAAGLDAGDRYQTLVGATGTGKTATMAWAIEKVGRPALVIAHNKTLAAQLCNEFREFFPANAVEYFVSYYDYYQPEAYVPHADLYIEKDSSR